MEGGDAAARGSATVQADRRSLGRGRLGAALVALALTSLPFLAVTFPPAADLPQHLAQVRLLEEAVHGGTGNFSFAEHASGIVAYRGPRPITWTRALEWYPELVTPQDLTAFDHALVVGGPRAQEEFQAFAAAATPLTARGRVRVYRLARPRLP